MLGIAYESGENSKNIEEAIKWYKMAALLNDPTGQLGLSRIYHHGDGVPKDSIEALTWIYVAASSGSPGTVGNSGIALGISTLEREVGIEGVKLAKQKAKDLAFEIKKNMVSQTSH